MVWISITNINLYVDESPDAIDFMVDPSLKRIS